MIFFDANFHVEWPYGMQVKPGVDVRTTFRRSMENVLRWRMNVLRDSLSAATRFPSLKGTFQVHSYSGVESYDIWIQTNAPEAVFLLQRAGIPPHLIFQAPHFAPRAKLVDWAESRGMQPAWLWAYLTNLYHSTEPWLIPHPGIKPDYAFFWVLDNARDPIDQATQRAIIRWARRFGMEEVTE